MKVKYTFLFVILVEIGVLLIYGCGKKDTARVFAPEEYEYHDGVAWVQLTEEQLFSTKYLGVACIDETGKEIFSIQDVRQRDVSNFYGGRALVDGQYIIDKTGTIICDVTDRFGGTAVMFPEGYFDGFIFVEKNVNGVNMTGILNEAMEWVIEPTAKFNNMVSWDNFLYYNNTLGFYDALTNEFIDWEETEERHFQRSYPENGMIFLKESGYCQFTYHAEYSEREIELSESCKTGFYNRDREMVIDLSDYPYVEALSEFQNGKCLIEFKTESGETYIGLINEKGEYIFIHTANNYKKYNIEEIKFYDCYFDWNGDYHVYLEDEK